MAFMQKPLALKKIHNFIKLVRANDNKLGKIPRSMIINFKNACNFKCGFCYSAEASSKHNSTHLDFATLKRVANEADALGMWEIVILGGELLIDIDSLLKLLEAIGTQRFQVVLITNGYFLTREVAKTLKQAGLDCVGVSVSTLDEQKHNAGVGGVKDAHQRALLALEYAKEAGMAAWPQVIFGHHNAKSKDLFDFLDYAKSKGYSCNIMMAVPCGVWKDEEITAEDMQILNNNIRKNYDCFFDTWDMYDSKRERLSGCGVVNRVYLTPLGDVLVCSYLNIKIGNVKEQSLKDILDYGFSIKYFSQFCPICIASQDKDFRKKFLVQETNIFTPLDAHKIFSKEDYCVTTE